MGTSLGAIILAQPGNPGCIVGAIYAPPNCVSPSLLEARTWSCSKRKLEGHQLGATERV